MQGRREFLKLVGSSGLVAVGCSVPCGWLSSTVAQTLQRQPTREIDRILVVIQLSGGNDGLNTVIPFEDDNYYRNRLTLAQSASSVHRINDEIGLHSSMNDMAELTKEGLMSVIQGVGYPQPNRSHFESMDLWHTAHRETQPIATGWLGRVLDQHQEDSNVPALHLGSEDQPLALAAEARDVPTLRSIDSFRRSSRHDEQLTTAIDHIVQAERDSSQPLLQHVQASAQLGAQTSQRVEAAIGKYRSPIDYPDSQLSQKLRGVAQLINAGLGTTIYYVTLDGFDTHSNQADSHSNLLGQLSSALNAFIKDLQHHDQLSRVMTFVFSEFGRRVKENASRGTDHGAAAPVFLAGGQLTTNVYGTHPSLVDLEDGDLKHSVDYRSIYATLLKHWLETDPEPILGQPFETLPLLAGIETGRHR